MVSTSQIPLQKVMELDGQRRGARLCAGREGRLLRDGAADLGEELLEVRYAGVAFKPAGAVRRHCEGAEGGNARGLLEHLTEEFIA